jgi:hypothetical protein
VNAALRPLTNRVTTRSVPLVARPPGRGSADEDAERDEEDAAAAEEVCGPSAEQEEAAVPEHVCAHDPLQRARRHVQAGANRRQRDPDHGDVERVEEERAAKDEQGAPGASIEGWRLAIGHGGGSFRGRCIRYCSIVTVHG